jgi:hypothetical protein
MRAGCSRFRGLIGASIIYSISLPSPLPESFAGRTLPDRHASCFRGSFAPDSIRFSASRCQVLFCNVAENNVIAWLIIIVTKHQLLLIGSKLGWGALRLEVLLLIFPFGSRDVMSLIFWLSGIFFFFKYISKREIYIKFNIIWYDLQHGWFLSIVQ